jgi:hypothetical protein
MSNDNQTTPGAITFTAEQVDRMGGRELMDALLALTKIPCDYLSVTELRETVGMIHGVLSSTLVMSTTARSLLEEAALNLDARAAVGEAAEG